jgi:hypothetical protein
VCGGRTIEGRGGKTDLVRCQTLAGRRTAGENGGGKVEKESKGTRGFHVYYDLDKQSLARLSKAVNELLRLDDD